jgi:WXG100 family type VII secretion target
MTILRVDTEAMATAATKIDGAIEEINGLLARLRGDVDAMLGSWSGPAADAHRELHVRFDRDANVINTSLAEMHGALVRTHVTYVQQERQQSSDHIVLSDQIRS